MKTKREKLDILIAATGKRNKIIKKLDPKKATAFDKIKSKIVKSPADVIALLLYSRQH